MEYIEGYDQELQRLLKKLNELEPGTEDYDKVHKAYLEAVDRKNELKKTENAEKASKADLKIKIGLGVAGVVLTPVIDYICKKGLAAFIGKVEQMEYFQSSPGRSISSWFRWKN